MRFKAFEWLGAVVTLVLLVAAVLGHSAALGACAVAALAVGVVDLIVREKVLGMRNIKLELPEDVRKKQAELESRISSIEFGIQKRGF